MADEASTEKIRLVVGHRVETLRQPLEDKVVTISRAPGSLSFPANFMLSAR
jgi:magnesium chelatase family protein